MGVENVGFEVGSFATGDVGRSVVGDNVDRTGGVVGGAGGLP